ncbi:hypothetical protein QJS66_18285 [Kocuria rhizophila]|nr:hypothetical protein QJS66_18285 [Kocuria rhizophila]
MGAAVKRRRRHDRRGDQVLQPADRRPWPERELRGTTPSSRAVDHEELPRTRTTTRPTWRSTPTNQRPGVRRGERAAHFSTATNRRHRRVGGSLRTESA